MNKRSAIVEFWVGMLVLLTLASAAFLALKVSDFRVGSTPETYKVQALFANIGGLKPQAKVTMSGVVIGRVDSITLDEGTFQALVTMRINKTFDDIPYDSSASIMTSGVLGDQYIGIDAGGEDIALTDGEFITLTQSALVLEELVNQLVTSFTQGGSE